MTESAPTVLITGAGSGFGEAMAHRFASRGYRVAVCDIDSQRAARVHEQIEAQSPGGLSCVMDVSKPEDWGRVHQQVADRWGGLNVLVNNAGVAAAGNCEETSLEDWRWVIDIDLMGVVYGCHRFIPLLRQTAARGDARCHVVNIASFAGLAGMPGLSAYGTAKAAVIALSEQLRAELHHAGVGVSVVCPAFVQTRLLDNFRTSHGEQRRRVERWMNDATVTAEEVADQTFNAVQDGQFLVLTHPLTRRAWWFRRIFPERYFHGIVKRTRRWAAAQREKQAA